MKTQHQQNNEVENNPIRVRTWIESSDVFVYANVLEDLEDSYKVIPDGREKCEIWLKTICDIVKLWQQEQV